MSVIPTREMSPQVVRAGGGAGGGYSGGGYPGGGYSGGGAPGGSLPAAARRAQAAAGQAEAGLTGRDVLRIIRKRKWLILFSLVICVGLAVAGTILWLQYLPLYTATALLEVRTVGGTPFRPERDVVPTDWLEGLAARYVSLTTGEPVLQAAVATDRVRNTRWFQKNPDDAVDRLFKEVVVSSRTGSGLLAVSMTGFDKDELAELVNAVAEQSQERSRETSNRGVQDQIRQFRTERTSLDEQRDRIRAEKAKLLRDADVPDMLERTNVLTMKLHGLAPQVTDMEMELAQDDGSVELIKKQIDTGEVANLPAVLQALDYDTALRTIQTNLLSVRSQLENAESRLGKQHRTVLNLTAQVKSMDQELDARKKELTAQAVRGLMANAEARKAIALERLTKIREQYRFVDVSVRGMRATYSAYAQLEGQEGALDKQIDNIDNRLVDLRILLKDRPPLSVVQSAATPREPSMPRWGIMMPLGVLLGLIVGLGLAFTLELVDTSIKGPSDVARRIDLPLLGMVPHQDDLEETVRDFRLAFSSHPNSLVSEAFRQIRTCLLFSGPANQRRTLLVTSALPEDGRTTVSLNLAACIARGGRKVLVVDANFRQPTIRTLFTSCPEGGLSSTLVGQAAWRDMVQQIEPNFHVMASGPLPPNPGELLGSEQMGRIISEMVTEYDQIIFDGAPCLLMTDAAALSTLVDGVILVVRAGANTFGLVQRTRDMLTRVGAHMVGVVLNGVRAVAGGYLRKNYEAFYDYQEPGKLPGK
jgi:polysaccharide biosynthesis transport protein